MNSFSRLCAFCRAATTSPASAQCLLLLLLLLREEEEELLLLEDDDDEEELALSVWRLRKYIVLIVGAVPSLTCE